MRIVENLGSMTMAARSENLCPPLGAYGREIYLRSISKGDCNRSCTRYHAPLRRHNQELVIHYIRGDREAMNKFNERIIDFVGDERSHVGHWDRGGHHRHRNSEAHNGTRFGGGCGRGKGGSNIVGGGVRGGHGSNTNPPTKMGRKIGAIERPGAKEVGWHRQNDDRGDGETSVRSTIDAHRRIADIHEVSHRHQQDISDACHHLAHSVVSYWLPQDISEACYAALKLRSAITLLT